MVETDLILKELREQSAIPYAELMISHLRKSYPHPRSGEIDVLKGISFEVFAGEMIAVVGASGAGKSTLLHIIGGLETANEGSVFIGENEVTRARGRDLARMRTSLTGLVFQLSRLLPDLTPLENVAMPLLIRRQNRREAFDRARGLLLSVGLEHRADQNVGELSGGEQQRVAIARALANNPRVLLADEPTGNLDAHTGIEIARLLLSCCRENQTCTLVATHNESIAGMCDRILLLKDGRLEQSGE